MVCRSACRGRANHGGSHCRTAPNRRILTYSHTLLLSRSFPRPGRSGSQMNEQDRVVSLRLFAQLNDHQLLIKKTTQLFVRIRKRRIGELVLTKETFHQFNGSLRFPVQRRRGDPSGDRRNGLKTSQRRSRVEH